MDALTSSLISTLLNLGTDVEISGSRVEVTTDGYSRIVIDAAPKSEIIHKCPHCGSTGAYYDTPRSKEGPKEWVAMNLGYTRVVISFKPQRIRCPNCGIVTAAVPWAFPNSGFTRNFDREVAWLALHMNNDSVAQFMGISWPTVNKAIDRVVASVEGDLSGSFDDLVEIGIDENAYGRGYNKFIMVVYNHRTQEIIWAKKGRSAETINSFFEELSEEQRANIKIVTVDGADWIHTVVKNQCPNAKICLDTFHIFQWLSEAADEVRQDVYKDKLENIKELKSARKELKKELKGSGSDKIKKAIEPYDNAIANLEAEAEILKKGKHLLTADPANLSQENLQLREKFLAIDSKLRQIASKIQSFREMMDSGDLDQANLEFTKFVNWARNCQFKAFNKVANTLMNFKAQILNTVKYKMTNVMVEATNNTIKFIIRQGYGFRNIDNLIKAIKFRCSKRYLDLLPNKCPRRILRSEWHTCADNLLAA